MTEPRDPTPEAFASEPLRTASINSHPITGKLLDREPSCLVDPTAVWENMTEPGPVDCVRAVMLPKDMVQLIGYDSQGIPRATLVLPLDSVDGTDEMCVLDLVRRRDRARRHLKLVG